MDPHDAVPENAHAIASSEAAAWAARLSAADARSANWLMVRVWADRMQLWWPLSAC